MHNCCFYLHMQLLTPLVPGLNVQMQNSEVLIMSPCLKSRLLIRSHVLEISHEQVSEEGTGKRLKRWIVLGRFNRDMEEHLYPVEICTGELLFSSALEWTSSKCTLPLYSKCIHLIRSKQKWGNSHVVFLDRTNCAGIIHICKAFSCFSNAFIPLILVGSSNCHWSQRCLRLCRNSGSSSSCLTQTFIPLILSYFAWIKLQ